MADIVADDTPIDVLDPQLFEPLPDEGPDVTSRDSSEDEKFETPPTTPLRLNEPNLGLDIDMERRASIERCTKVALPAFFAEPARIGSKKRPFPEPEPMRPPPARKISCEEKSERPIGPYTVPTPAPEDHHFVPQSVSSFRSFDNMSSVTSSSTSISPAWTSPNTSFSSEPMATSFDSAAEETDTTVRSSLDQQSPIIPLGSYATWLNKHEDLRHRNGLGAGTLYSKGLVADQIPQPHQEQHVAINTAKTTPATTKPDTALASDLLNRLTYFSPFGIFSNAFVCPFHTADFVSGFVRSVYESPISPAP